MEEKSEQVVRRKGKNTESKTSHENDEKTSDEKEKNSINSKPTVPTSTSKEYTQAVSEWLNQYRMHQWMQHQALMISPYFLGSPFPPMTYPFAPSGNNNQGGISAGDSRNLQQVPPVQVTPPGVQFPFQFPPPFPQNILPQQQQQPPLPQQQQPPPPQQQQQQQPYIPQLQASEFTLPSLYRRITAEIIDFIMLFIVKLGITLFVIEYMGIVDPSSFVMRFLIEEIDEDSTFEDLQQMLLFALIYRAVVCTYETFFLRFGLGTRVGGATPGKYCMGLRVVSCDRVQSLGGNRVLVTSPEDLTYLQAFLRAIIKNFSMAFFFPACITVFFNPHFRAAYGILTRTVVVSVPNWAERLRPRNR